MHIAPFVPAPKKLLPEIRDAGMDFAWNCLLGGMGLMVFMFLVAPSLPGFAGALLTHVLAIGVIASVLGIFVAMTALWIPSHDDLIRRRNEPLYEGVHVRRIALICRFFSTYLLRATPPSTHPSLNLRAAQSCAAKTTLSSNAFTMVKKMMNKKSAASSSGTPRRIHIEQTSALIGKTETTIRTCASNKKYQHLIPPPFKMPNSRRLCWWEHEVLAWMQSNRPAEPPPTKRPRGRPTKTEQ